MTQRTKTNAKAFMIGMFAGATVLVLAAQMGGCYTVGGALHGASRDYDAIIDSGAK